MDPEDNLEPDAVPEVVETPQEVVEEHTTDHRPGWVDEILSAVSGLGDRIDTSTSAPEHTPEGDNGTEMPGHGEEIPPDEGPAKKPWTHRRLFG